MIDLAYYVGRALLLLTVLSSVSAAFRRDSRQRVDIALFVCLLAISGALPGVVPFALAIQMTMVTFLPFVAFRFVGHFRDVPAGFAVIGSVVPLMFGALQAGADPRLVSGWMRTASQAYVGLGFCYAATAMAIESRGALGVRGKRLGFAALGTASFSATSLLDAGIVQFGHDLNRQAQPLVTYLDTFTLVCYYLAFSTPHGLTTRWRRAEQATYLAQVSERDPEERGERAAGDLVDGANRCVGGTLALVALRSSPDSDAAHVVAASGAGLAGRTIACGPGLLNRVMATRVAAIATPSDCEPEIEAAVAAAGVSVLAAPIVASGRSWGVVVAVHRRGALFPEDDVSMLAQLARNAATALDHAALIIERRARAQQESARRLRELESRVGLMLDSIKDYAMLVVDHHGAVAAWHPGAELVFGYSREQVMRRSAASLFELPDATFSAWLSEAVMRGLTEREGTCRRHDGQTFIGVTTIRPLVDEPGAPPGFVVVTQDVTERRSLEERLRQGQKMQAIGQLAGGVAHDFNNLLTAILGYADWLEQDLAGDRRLEQVREIQRAAERAADLTRRLLAFSRKQMVQPSPIDVTRLIADLLPMLRRLIGDRIEIVDASLPLAAPVMGDRSQVEQIVLNLVLNARDAMPDGGLVTIRTADVWRTEDAASSSQPGPYVLIEVADTGAGMDAETRRRAFEPFFTTKEVGRGTGLGLATVYGIVQQMDGVIDVESQPGRGATFRIYLPHASAAPVTAPLPEPAAELLGRETVLLVEDDQSLRPYLVQVLERNGYRVIAAESSEAALQLTDSVQYAIDLVISDVTMPGRSGPELVAELLRSRPGLPALYISGHAEGHLPSTAAASDRRHLLQKPFSSNDFLAKVRQILAAA